MKMSQCKIDHSPQNRLHFWLLILHIRVKCDLDVIKQDSPIKRDGEKPRVSKKSASNPEELVSAHGKSKNRDYLHL